MALYISEWLSQTCKQRRERDLASDSERYLLSNKLLKVIVYSVTYNEMPLFCKLPVVLTKLLLKGFCIHSQLMQNSSRITY